MSINWEASKTIVFDTINKVEKKTEKFIDIQKIRFNISEINSELNQNYLELGKYIFNNSDADEEVVLKYKKKIGFLNIKLKKENEKLSNLLMLKICNNCGYKNNNDAKYCSGCSEKLM